MLVDQITQWLERQPTSKRRTTRELIETGLRNRVANSDTVNAMVSGEAEKFVSPCEYNLELLNTATAELNEYIDMGYTVKQAQHYASKGGSNNTALNKMLTLLGQIDIAQADYGRWQYEVEQEREKIWSEIRPQIDATIQKIVDARSQSHESL